MRFQHSDRVDAQRECCTICQVQPQGKPPAFGKTTRCFLRSFLLTSNLFLALRGHIWCDIPPRTQDCSRRSQAGKRSPSPRVSSHRQVKQANILVDGAGTARIADFGLMTMTDLSTVVLSKTVVSPGGTLGWMSPELLDPPRFCSDGCPTRESDCYALGMVIYEASP